MLIIAIIAIIALCVQVFRLKKQRNEKHFLACRYKELCIYAVENSVNKHSILDYYLGRLEEENIPPFYQAASLAEAVDNVMDKFKEDLYDEENLNIYNYTAN